MYLRYVINGVSEIATITRMQYCNKTNKAYFTLSHGSQLCATGIDLSEWNRLVADMFSDGKLSLANIPSVTTEFVK